ncbi:hypothetical protein Tco_0614954 [Tanacetum coccineum]
MIATPFWQRQSGPGEVTDVNFYYLRSMDRGTANVLYLLAQYLFKHAEGRKSESRLSGGYFIGRLADHIGLDSDDGLRGFDYAWVALGLKRQPIAAADAPEAAEDAPTEDEGAQSDQAPAHAPPPPPAPQPRSMSQRSRVSTDYGDSVAWSQLMDSRRPTYQAFLNITLSRITTAYPKGLGNTAIVTAQYVFNCLPIFVELSLGHSEALINTPYAQKLKMENYLEHTIREVSSF